MRCSRDPGRDGRGVRAVGDGQADQDHQVRELRRMPVPPGSMGAQTVTFAYQRGLAPTTGTARLTSLQKSLSE